MSKKFPWYTACGDDGTTGLLGAGRVPKYHPQPEAFGAIDEANSMLGLARATTPNADVKAVLVQVQRHCYELMAELAATPDQQPKFRKIDQAAIDWLTSQTDHFGTLVEMPREFVLPGDTLADAALDIARTSVRRAERRVAKLVDDGLVENRHTMGYLNRLSSLLFVLGRYAAAGEMTLAKEDAT